MNKWLLILLGISLAFSLMLLGKVGCQNIELKNRTSQLNQELMKSNLALGRAETQFGNANKYIKELEQAQQNEIKQREAIATRYGEIEARYKVLRKQLKSKGKIIKEGTVIRIPEKLKLTNGLLYQALADGTIVAIEELHGRYEDDTITILAKVKPYPNNNRDIPFEFQYGIDMKFKVQLTETLTPSGAINHYANLYHINEDGEVLKKLDIERFQMTVEKPNKKRWYWWAPHIDAGGLVGGTLTFPKPYLGGSIGVSAMGYGLTVNDLDWRGLRLSLDLVNGRPNIGITPVIYNIGQLLPLFSNVWVGPHLSWILPSDFALGIFTGVML